MSEFEPQPASAGTSTHAKVGTTPPRAYVAGVLATSVAAAAAAILTSYFGVQGTILGAMVGAAVASIASQAAQVPLSRLEHRIFTPRRVVYRGMRLPRAHARKPALRFASAARRPRRQLLPARAALGVAVFGFSVAMAGITAYEAAQGRPLSARASETGTGTSLQQVLHAAPPAASSGESASAAQSDPATPGSGEEDSKATPAAQPAFLALSATPRAAVSPATTPAATTPLTVTAPVATTTPTAPASGPTAGTAATPQPTATPDAPSKVTSSSAPPSAATLVAPAATRVPATVAPTSTR